jgi:hypothetical protein
MQQQEERKIGIVLNYALVFIFYDKWQVLQSSIPRVKEG